MSEYLPLPPESGQWCLSEKVEAARVGTAKATAAENVRKQRIISVHSTEEEAEAARDSMDHPKNYQVWQA